MEKQELTSDGSSTRADGERVLVSVKGLRKHYGAIRAVDGIDFEVHRGDVLAFLGPNGAGKTTAMKMITGFLEPDGGTVTIGGRDVWQEPLAVKARVGYLPENAPAYGEMTPDSFLRFIAEVRQLPEPDKALARVVEMTRLGKVMHQQIDTLSKGFKRRVGLAQALIHDPEVLILDEPTDGLDPNQKALVQELIAGLSKEKCIVLSTHILDEAERVCNRALIISQGKILVDSTPAELVRRAPGHNVVRVRFAAAAPDGVVAKFSSRDWCENAALLEDGALEIVPMDGRNHMATILAELEGCEVSDVRLETGRLDDLFREVTEGVAA